MNVVWQDPVRKIKRIYLGTNKELFNAELYATGGAVAMALQS